MPRSHGALDSVGHVANDSSTYASACDSSTASASEDDFALLDQDRDERNFILYQELFGESVSSLSFPQRVSTS